MSLDRTLLAALSLATVLTGCAVGPDFQRPAPPKVTRYTPEVQSAESNAITGSSQRLVEGGDIPGQWWALFHSPSLNALIERALKANPDLHAAQASLRVARENVRAQEGVYYPDVQAGFSPSRQKNAVGTLAPTLTSGTSLYSLYTTQVGISYIADVFGGNRRQVESLQAQAESQRFQLEAAYLTLTSNLALGAVQEASLRGQIEATQALVNIGTEQLGLMKRQNELGSIAEADVIAQRAALAQLEATLPILRKQLAQQRDQLAALAGNFPSEEHAEHFELSALQLPQELPLSLPSKLIEQRPDVRAAEANLHAASAQVGVAIANRLPQITLSGTAGGTSTDFRQMFAAGNVFWSAAGSLTQVLFDGDTLLHRQRAADAALDEAAAQYQSTVITACQNVADTLRALQYDADVLKSQEVAAQAATQSLDIARHAMALGATSYLALLIAEQAYQQSHIALVQAKANQYSDTVALFQALGGGWWNRVDVAISSKGDAEKR
jgi:NodT family efflux transporter outer membrane factor (OMF) lipoprotein